MKHITKYIHADKQKFVLASNAPIEMIYHLVGLPCEREDYVYEELFVSYECRVGPDCPFCRQDKAVKEGKLDPDLHTHTKRASTFPAYDMADGDLKLFAFTPMVGNLIKKHKSFMGSVLEISTREVGTNMVTTISVLDFESDRAKYPCIEDNWGKRLDFGTLKLNSLEEVQKLQEYQLASLRKAKICRYTIGYLEDRWKLL